MPSTAITLESPNEPVNELPGRPRQARRRWDNEARSEEFAFRRAAAARPLHPHQADVLAALAKDRRTRLLIHVATGGGKTRVANDWVWCLRRRGKRVLWITKDWSLLR